MARSIAKQVYDWLKERPYIVSALKKDLINFSSLSRVIQKELGIKNFAAVLVAVRRFQREKKEAYESTGEEVIDLLKRSRLEIRTGIRVYIIKHDVCKAVEKMKYLHIVKGSNLATVITEEKLDISYIKKKENLIEVRIISPPEIEAILGFVGYVCSTLAEKGIVIVETYSCHTDTIFVFDKKDLSKVVDVLKSIGIQ